MFGYGAKMHQCVNIFILGNFSAENQQPAYKIAGKGAIRYYFRSIKRLALLTNPTESADFHYDLPPISCFFTSTQLFNGSECFPALFSVLWQK